MVTIIGIMSEVMVLVTVIVMVIVIVIDTCKVTIAVISTSMTGQYILTWDSILLGISLYLVVT